MNKILFLSSFLLITTGCGALKYNVEYNVTSKSDFINELYLTKLTLDKKEKKDIVQFMDVGYKKYPALKNKDILTIPIYAIYGNLKGERHKFTLVKDSLLYYLNPHKMQLDEVAFYEGNNFIGIAEPSYDNYKGQLIGRGMRNDWLNNIIREEKPDLIFYVINSYFPVFILKDNELYCYTKDFYSKLGNKKEKFTIDEYIKEFLTVDEFFLLIRNAQKKGPIIYAK